MPLSAVFPLANPRLRDRLRAYHLVLLPIINTVQVRVPYQTLIETYANEFFSAPILCTMGEKISTLKGRDEHAMEKDVFQDPKYRSHVENKEQEAKLNEKKRVDHTTTVSA